MLRLWLRGEGLRGIERLSGLDRKTVRRYAEAVVSLGLSRDQGEDQLDELFIGAVVEAVRPHRTDGHGEAWRLLVVKHDQIKEWLDTDLAVVKVLGWMTGRGLHDGATVLSDRVATVARIRRGTHVPEGGQDSPAVDTENTGDSPARSSRRRERRARDPLLTGATPAGGES